MAVMQERYGASTPRATEVSEISETTDGPSAVYPRGRERSKANGPVQKDGAGKERMMRLVRRPLDQRKPVSVALGAEVAPFEARVRSWYW
jgi:hypothetical protein